MIPADFIASFANHLWQSTVFAGVAALLALALRRNHARARYWLWFFASLKFLVPFSLFVEAGSRLARFAARWTAGRVSGPALPAVVEQISQPFVPLHSFTPFRPAIAAHHAISLPAVLPGILLALWICGAVLVAFLWWYRWRGIRAAVRSASPLQLPAARHSGVPVRSSPAMLEPGVFGIFRPVLLLPQGITDRLAAAHLEAIVAHELCHVRRRDNLAAAIHMLVEALFWFHPLVWWLGARLVEERERACDEEVLRLGNHPEVYAESILKTCQFYLESPLVCMSGIAGSDLKKRIVRIMTARAVHQLSLGRKLLLSAAAMAAVAGPVGFGLLNAPPGRAQSSAPASAAHPSFDVVSIKPNHIAADLFRITAQPNRFTADHATVKFLLQEAYHVKEDQISGAPAWTASEHYEIEAKADDSSSAGGAVVNHDEQTRHLRLMLQSLLEDRFHLVLHHETKELPLYALVVARGGPKMNASALVPDEPLPQGPPTPDAPQPRHSFRMMGSGDLRVVDQSMDRFVDVLSRQVGRLVVNQTGLTGQFDFTLQWTPDERPGRMAGNPAGDAPPPEHSGPSIFTALQEQLGLKLESRKGPVDTIVIDRVERPSEN